LTNKSLVNRYDTLVAHASRRAAQDPSPAARSRLLSLVARLNARGMRELHRRHRDSEERLWKDSLFPPLLPPGG
jgi:hypothetical protein